MLKKLFEQNHRITIAFILKPHLNYVNCFRTIIARVSEVTTRSGLLAKY